VVAPAAEEEPVVEEALAEGEEGAPVEGAEAPAEGADKDEKSGDSSSE
jgi:hypothetical protein